MRCTEGGDFDDLTAKDNMNQFETAADQARIAEEVVDLFRRGVGGYVKIFRIQTEQSVAHTTADQIGFVSGIIQAIEHFQCGVTDLAARDAVLVAGNNLQRYAGGFS